VRFRLARRAPLKFWVSTGNPVALWPCRPPLFWSSNLSAPRVSRRAPYPPHQRCGAAFYLDHTVGAPRRVWPGGGNSPSLSVVAILGTICQNTEALDSMESLVSDAVIARQIRRKMGTNDSGRRESRSIPSRLSPVLKELELRQPRVVTKSMLADILSRRGAPASADQVAYRLQKHGWLLTLRTRGAWEFAPAARAGPFGAGDRFVELRAVLALRPNFEAAVAFESAAWLHNLARRVPEREVMAVPRGTIVPHSLRSGFRITNAVGKLPPVFIDKLPVWRMETLLVLIAAYPDSFRAWPTIQEWLHDAAARVEERLLREELGGRPPAVWAKTGYILELAGRSDLATEVVVGSELRDRGPVYLGPRTKRGKHSRRWNVIDSVLLPNWSVEAVVGH